MKPSSNADEPFAGFHESHIRDRVAGAISVEELRCAVESLRPDETSESMDFAQSHSRVLVVWWD